MRPQRQLVKWRTDSLGRPKSAEAQLSAAGKEFAADGKSAARSALWDGEVKLVIILNLVKMPAHRDSSSCISNQVYHE